VARRLRLVAVGVVVAGVAFVFVVLGLSSNGSTASARRAPALPAETLTGPRVTISSLLGRPGANAALVVFWASWCGPCAQEAPALERFARSPAGRGRLVGVDWSDGAAGARSFISHYGWSFPNLRDGEGTIGNAYGLTGLPTTFVLVRGGLIRAVLRGPQDEASLGRALSEAERSA